MGSFYLLTAPWIARHTRSPLAGMSGRSQFDRSPGPDRRLDHRMLDAEQAG
jgi:hypothetical protein